MIHEEPELLSDIHYFSTPCYVILRRKSSEWLESSIESDLVKIKLLPKSQKTGA